MTKGLARLSSDCETNPRTKAPTSSRVDAQARGSASLPWASCPTKPGLPFGTLGRDLWLLVRPSRLRPVRTVTLSRLPTKLACSPRISSRFSETERLRSQVSTSQLLSRILSRDEFASPRNCRIRGRESLGRRRRRCLLGCRRDGALRAARIFRVRERAQRSGQRQPGELAFDQRREPPTFGRRVDERRRDVEQLLLVVVVFFFLVLVRRNQGRGCSSPTAGRKDLLRRDELRGAERDLLHQRELPRRVAHARVRAVRPHRVRDGSIRRVRRQLRLSERAGVLRTTGRPGLRRRRVPDAVQERPRHARGSLLRSERGGRRVCLDWPAVRQQPTDARLPRLHLMGPRKMEER